jgi:HEAT repeat protein
LPELTRLGSEDDGVRQTAAKALGERSDLRAVEPLIITLWDEFSDVRRAAAWALKRIGTPEELAALEDRRKYRT